MNSHTEKDAEAQSQSRAVAASSTSLLLSLLTSLKKPTQQGIESQFGEMVALNNEYLGIIEDERFQRLMKYMNPNVPFPQKTDLPRIMSDTYVRIRDKIKNKITYASAFSITYDISEQDNNTFFTVSVHWISPEFTREQAVLVALSPYDATYESEDDLIRYYLCQWDIPLEKIHNVVQGSTDYSRKHSLSHDGRLSGVVDNDLPAKCFIQSIQEAVEKSIKAQGDVISTDFLLATAASIEEHNILHSGHEETRWQSNFLMKRLLRQNKPELNLNKNVPNNLIPAETDMINQFLTLILPLETIIKNTSCISEVIPNLDTVLIHLKDEASVSDKDCLKNMRLALIEGLEELKFENDDKFLIATFLDPRYKKTIDEVLVKKIWHILLSSEEGDSENEDDGSPVQKKRAKRDEDPIWKHMEERNKKNIAAQGWTPSLIPSNPKAVELLVYMGLPNIHRSENPWEWWSKNEQYYPSVAELAKKFLSSPAISGSVCSERFLQSGISNEEERNRLLAMKDENIAFIAYNLHLGW